MRIQHNIMAMNAYRNYNNNTSALAKNLEKLSSGYRINRAGDDAAGLAISEKMRAQITGLDAAQKNVKDGVSLVKTAEGAMQEIHDMLGRMKYLATQSANGTYDNEVDRANLQKEVESLKSEINRIADSANFNGQKLLNGALDAGADFTAHGTFTAGKNLPGVGQILGTNTVLETANKPAQGTEFSIDLHNIEFSNKQGEALTIQIGDKTLTMKAGEGGIVAGTTMTTQNIIDALKNGQFKDADGKAFTGNDLTFGGQKFDMTATGTRVTFKQSEAPKTAAEVVNGKMTVTISGGAAKAADIHVTGATKNANSFTTDTSTEVVRDENAKGVSNAIATGVKAFKFEGKKADGTDLEIKIEGAGNAVDLANATAAEKANAIVEELKKNADFNEAYDVSADASGVITVTAKNAHQGESIKMSTDTNNAGGNYTSVDNGAAGVTGAEKGHTLTIGGGTFADNTEFTIDGKTYKKVAGTSTTPGEFSTFDELKAMLAKENIEISSTGGAGHEFDANAVLTFKNAAAPADADQSLTGDYNVSTDVITAGHDKSSNRLASTAFELKKEMINEGGNIRIGDETYNFVKTGSGANGAAAAGEIVIGDLDRNAADFLSTVAERLTQAAKNNKTYTVGHDGTRMTFTENQAYKDLPAADKKYDLSTLKGIEDSFAWNGANQTGAALNLQIGDSSKDYDQLAVSVKDVHTKALGIDDLDISTQAGAHEAIDKIMDAINNVSSTRGDLGAIQNRLEHTEKNLSVMQESIQDAESAIRDTDVAAEMMKYTKNNILIQSAQAMLAQANQVPQGVLQLLQ